MTNQKSLNIILSKKYNNYSNNNNYIHMNCLCKIVLETLQEFLFHHNLNHQ